MPATAALHVEVVFCPQPGVVDATATTLTTGATLADALHASGVLARHALPLATLQAGIWSQRQALHAVLGDGDRVEVYRPLLVDPKEARRLRQRLQREDTAAR